MNHPQHFGHQGRCACVTSPRFIDRRWIMIITHDSDLYSTLRILAEMFAGPPDVTRIHA